MTRERATDAYRGEFRDNGDGTITFRGQRHRLSKFKAELPPIRKTAKGRSVDYLRKQLDLDAAE